jgi:hypothetical protein
MFETAKIDLHIITYGLTFTVNDVDVKVDVHGLNKNRLFLEASNINSVISFS